MSNKRLLKRCGEARSGPRWQSDIARDLKVADRTVRRWVSGAANVPDSVYLELLTMCQARAADLDDLMAVLRAAAPPTRP